MPSFSQRSQRKLDTCVQPLQDLFTEVVKHFDCAIIDGHRDSDRQTMYYRSGRSKARFPESKHNSLPSKAVDVGPYPLDWEAKDRWYFFCGYVKATAKQMGIKVRWGGDWDSDNSFSDQTFNDLAHWEIVDE